MLMTLTWAGMSIYSAIGPEDIPKSVINEAGMLQTSSLIKSDTINARNNSNRLTYNTESNKDTFR